MATRTRTTDAARRRAAALQDRVLRELRDGRMERNLSGAVIATALGWSASKYSRFERGVGGPLAIEDLAVALAAVGLDLSVLVHPGGPPLRDVAHARLIERSRARCHPSVRLLTEVPLPDGSARAWDVSLLGVGWRHAVEAETRPRDRQALERPVALKTRDDGADRVSLLLLDSRHNRDFVRIHERALRERFPVPAAVALAALGTGIDPGAGSVILLKRATASPRPACTRCTNGRRAATGRAPGGTSP